MIRSTRGRRGPRLISLIAVLVVGLLIAAGPASRSVAAADPSADIPGVPMPGPVAAGRLGGGIYDVVYSLEVEPGHVIVASLTGTEGTDFDLYLFDASATTVLSTTGQLTKSTGPTSSEAISWPARSGGTFYIDLNGATDVEGDYRLTVQSVPDATPPTVSIALAAGRSSTNQTTVPVSLNAIDDLSGVAEMAFSTDGISFGPWQPFASSTTWTFPSGDGTRTLWARVRNGVGLQSPPASDSVVFDTVVPFTVDINPPPNSSVTGLRPRFTVSFTEAMDAASWIDLGLVVQSATGALVSGAYVYDSIARTGSFTPSITLQPGAVYIVTVGDVRDLAGNRVLSPGSWSIIPLAPTSLTATASPGVILRGGSSRIAVSLAGAPVPATVDVQSSTISGGSIQLPAISTEDGQNLLVVTPATNATYRFRYAGTSGVAPSQVDVRVLVRRSVVLAGRSSSVVSRAKVDSSVLLTAAISPPSAGTSVSFRLYRFDADRRAWVYAGSRGRNTNASGRATYTWIPPASGSYYWRVGVASTPDFANNTSPVYRWSISR